VPAGTCLENEVRQIDACFRPASLMATAPTNSSDSWEVRHVPGVDDASVPCPLISRCEEHSAHICCRHAFLPPSFLLSPVRVSCPERTFLKVRASEHGHGFSQPCAAFTPTRAHVMSCLIHDSRLTSAIDLGHTLPPCLSPYQASSASSLLLLVMCIYASMHRSCLDGEPRLGVALAFTGARTCPHARSNARPVSACRGLATVAVVQKPRKARDVGLPWYIPGFASRV